MSIESQVLNFANKFDPYANAVEKEKITYKGCDVYSAYQEEDGEPVRRSIGLPYFILHDKVNKKLRYVHDDEALALLDML